MRRVLFIICVCLGLILIPCVPWIINNLRYEDFIISGTVTDDEGNVLDTVGVKVTAGRLIKMGFESDYDSKFDTISKSFRYERNNYSSVGLWFFKEGYEDQRFSWGTGGKYIGIRVVLKRKAPTTDRQ